MVLLLQFTPRLSSAQDPEFSDRSKQPFVNKILFVGNSHFSDDELRSRMRTKQPRFFSVFNRPRLRMDFLRRDIAALEALYKANGFLDASVTLGEIRQLEDEAFVDIIIDIVEKEPRRVERVKFYNPGPVSLDELEDALRLKPGVPFNPSLLDADVYSLKRLYFDLGHVGVKVQDSVLIEGRSVYIDLTFDAGPVVTIRDIEIRGNVLTKTREIERELAIEPGDVFRLSKLGETQANLYETGLFTVAELTFRNLDTEAKTVDIVVRVRERKSGYIEFGFGVGNVVGSRVSGEWGDRNIFGSGRGLSFGVEYSFSLFDNDQFGIENWNPRIRYYRYDGRYSQRHFFWSKLFFGLNAFYERDGTIENLVVKTLGITASGRRRLSRNIETIVSLSDERITREFTASPSTKSNSRIFGDLISHDTRDFILDPKSGGYRDIRVQLAGGVLGGDNDFYTLDGTFQRYVPVTSGLVFAARARWGYAQRYGNSPVVPVENRYFTGGGNSVRGFNENSLGPTAVTATGVEVIGGRALLLTNFELRFPIPWLIKWRFTGATFFDGGNSWESVKAISLRDFRLYSDEAETRQEDYRYSIGFGVRYNTPVGPIRFDYGIPIKQEVGVDSSGRFHFSLGQIF
ncbi:MAG: outer membrane protein assembly factor BamA [bacterium]|nr:outer membrane protein assembly factor BamA [bacterium]